MRLVSICAMTLLLLPSSVRADPQGPKPFGPRIADIPNRKMSDEDKARYVTNDFATCIVKRYKSKVETALAVGSLVDSYRLLNRVADPDCIGSIKLKMPAALLRGAAFRALYIRDFGKEPPKGPPLSIDYVKEAGTDPYAYQKATLTAFGSCVAKLSPGAARSLVLSEVASDEESKAVAALRPSLGDCLRDGTLKLNRGVLQASLAEVLYREKVPVPVVSAEAR